MGGLTFTHMWKNTYMTTTSGGLTLLIVTEVPVKVALNTITLTHQEKIKKKVKL
jgi:hypothetical protein